MSTYPPKYLILQIGAKARLNVLKRANPANWRKARAWNFNNAHAAFGALDQGFNGLDAHKTPIWYCRTGAQFRHEKYAHELSTSRIHHTGWYCDTEQYSLARGIVGMLPHGKFIAGYELSDSGERVYFPDVYSDEYDAAKMADEHARIIAESSMEYSIKYDEARKLESDIENAYSRLEECIALRHVACMDYVKDEISELIQTIRDNRETLQNDYAGVL